MRESIFETFGHSLQGLAHPCGYKLQAAALTSSLEVLAFCAFSQVSGVQATMGLCYLDPVQQSGS